jgi:hypothetical protein
VNTHCATVGCCRGHFPPAATLIGNLIAFCTPSCFFFISVFHPFRRIIQLHSKKEAFGKLVQELDAEGF